MKVLYLVIVSLNVTKYMPQKCQIRQIYGYQVCFSSSKYSKTRFRHPAGGAYNAPPYPIVGWGGGHALPIPSPSTSSASRSRRLRRFGCQAPNTNSWLRLCSYFTKALWMQQLTPLWAIRGIIRRESRGCCPKVGLSVLTPSGCRKLPGSHPRIVFS